MALRMNGSTRRYTSRRGEAARNRNGERCCTSCGIWKLLNLTFYKPRSPRCSRGTGSFHAECRTCISVRNKAHYAQFGAHKRQQQNAIQRESRLTCLMHYCKGKPKCACCEVEELLFLTIDHIIGRREQEGLSGRLLYRWLIKNNFPEGYQVLCFNCNTAKYINGVCPHQLVKEVDRVQAITTLSQRDLPQLQVQ